MREVLNDVLEVVKKAKEKSKGIDIRIKSFRLGKADLGTGVKMDFLHYKLLEENGELWVSHPNFETDVIKNKVSSIYVIPMVRDGMNKLLFNLDNETNEWKCKSNSSVIGYITVDEKRTPDRLHKAIVFGDESKAPQFKSMLKAKFNIDEKHLTQIKLSDHIEKFRYSNSHNGSLYDIMLFKYFENNITRNTIFNTAYINLKSDMERVIFGEESDIDKVRKWYTGKIAKAFISDDGVYYLYLNMDLVDTEEQETEKIVYRICPFNEYEEVPE